jgi:predicted DNA-binding antitoxin AbrB/MazE fold protein
MDHSRISKRTEVIVETVRIIEAIFEDGVFKPLQDPRLREGQHGILVRQEWPGASPEDPVAYSLYVGEAIEAGLEDVKAGRVVSLDELRARLELE